MSKGSVSTMRAKLTWLIPTAALLVLIASIGLVANYFSSAGVKRAQAVLDALPYAERKIPNSVKDVVFRVERRSDETGVPSAVVAFVANSLVRKSSAKYNIAVRHIIGWSTYHVLKIRFTDDEIYALYSQFVPFEHGHGMAKAAQYHFGQELATLEPHQVVLLLAVGRSPIMYSQSDHSTDLAEIQSQMWAKYLEFDAANP
jgi:Transglycosylase